MKQRTLRLACTLGLVSQMTLSAFAQSFTDVSSNSWYSSFVNNMAQGGYVQGKTTTTFQPNDTLTVAEFSTMIANAFYGNTLGAQQEQSHSQWWGSYMETSLERGGLEGTTAGNYYQSNKDWGTSVNQPITRYDMAMTICNLLTERGVEVADGKDISAYESFLTDTLTPAYETAVVTAMKYGFLEGRSTGEFDGTANLSRAEAAVVLQALVTSDLIVEENVRHYEGNSSTATTPEVTTPEVTTPEVTTPEVTTPEVTTPDSTTDSATDSTTDSSSDAAATSLAAMAEQMLTLVNAERTKVGLKPLELEYNLMSAAQFKSEEMYELNYFSHTSPVYGDMENIFKKFGMNYWTIAENIASSSSVEAAMSQWMNSSGHKANILNENMTHFGVGVAGNYWTQQFAAFQSSYTPVPYNSDGSAPAQEYYVIGAISPGGDASWGVTKATEGQEVTVTYTPDSGYQLNQVLLNGKELTASKGKVTFSMPAENVIIAISFEEIPETSYTITSNSPLGGTVSVAQSGKAGDSVTITLTPDTDYSLSSLTLNGTALTFLNNKATFTMPSQNVTISAGFTKDTVVEVPQATEYTITTTSTTNGTMQAPTSALPGKLLEVQLTPNAGYEVSSFKVNGVEATVTNNVGLFTMPEGNVTLTASFTAVVVVPEVDTTYYTVYSDTPVNGAIGYKNSAQVGDEITVTLIPHTGYELASFTVNGVANPVDGTKSTFTMPAKNVTLVATYKATSTSTTTPDTTTPDSTNTDTSTTPESTVSIPEQMLELVNIERAKVGLKPLQLEQNLMDAAQFKSEEMYELNYFSHTSPVYGDMENIFKKFGINYWTIAENIATSSSVETVMTQWMNSSGHKANILNENMTHFGIGVAGRYWTQQFAAFQPSYTPVPYTS